MEADHYGMGVSDDIQRLSLGRGKAQQKKVDAPELHNQGVVVVDVTDQFIEAAKVLEPGEVVKDGFFTLFESVTALEIMDPKMDSGLVKPGDEFEELYDVSSPLLPEEVLGIIDQLLCHEMSWHLGYPLSQTVFTSVHVEALMMPNPVGIEQAKFVRDGDDPSERHPLLQVLQAYCLGMLKGCGYVNELIKSEHFYEEEDFVTNMYNRSLLVSVPTDAIRLAIADARERLKSLQDTTSQELLDALDHRLELRDIFLSAAECPQHVKEPDRARSPWQEGLRILPLIKATHHLAKSVDDAFSAKLQKKLASTIAPRPIVHLSFEDAFGHLTRFFEDGLEIIGVLHYTDSQCLQNFVMAIEAKKPQPLVYVRTLLQTFLFDAMEVLGSMSIRQMLDDDLSIITLPANPQLDRANDEIEVVHDPRFTMSQQMEFFRQRAAQPYLDILRTFCQNRCRVRRTLFHVATAWDNLQLDAEEIDQIIQTAIKERPKPYRSTAGRDTIESYSLPLSSWTYLYKLKIMEWIVQLGFELAIYQPDELAGMYWYLNYLSKCRLQHTERVRFFVIQRVEEVKKQSRIPDPTVEKELKRSVAYARLSLLDAAVTWELSDAMSCVYAVLNRLKLVKIPPRPYGNDELRYDVRMKPLAAITLPELPSFEVFTTAVTQPDTSALDILDYAEKALAGAKKGLEVISKLSPEESFSVGSHERWTASIKNARKSTIAAGLAIATLQSAIRKVGEQGDLKLKAEIPTPDEAYHFWWIAPKLVPLK